MKYIFWSILTFLNIFTQGKWHLETSLKTAYNDNILGYSDFYQRKFLNLEDEERFKIESLDDLIVSSTSKLYTNFRLTRKRRSQFSIAYHTNTYMVNSIKNNHNYSVNLRLGVSKRFQLGLYAKYSPEIYVRHYKGKSIHSEISGQEVDEFIPFSFSKQDYIVFIHNNLTPNLSIRIKAKNSFLRYNEFYPNHDSDILSYDFSSTYKATRSFRIIPRAVTGKSTSIFDLDKFAQEFQTELSITSHTFAQYYITFVKKFGKNHKLKLSSSYQLKNYSSKQPLSIAPLYSGRIDRLRSIGISYEYKLSKMISFHTGVTIKIRTSSSDTIKSNLLEKEKNFNQSLYSFGLEVSLF